MQVFRHATKTMAAMRYAPAVPKKWLAAVRGLRERAVARGADVRQRGVDHRHRRAAEQPRLAQLHRHAARARHAQAPGGVDDHDREGERGERVHGVVAVQQAPHERPVGVGGGRRGQGARAHRGHDGGRHQGAEQDQERRGQVPPHPLHEPARTERRDRGDREERRREAEQPQAAVARQGRDTDLIGHRGGAGDGEEGADRQVQQARERHGEAPGDGRRHLTDRARPRHRRGDDAQDRQPHRRDEEAERGRRDRGARIPAQAGGEDQVARAEEQAEDERGQQQGLTGAQARGHHGPLDGERGAMTVPGARSASAPRLDGSPNQERVTPSCPSRCTVPGVCAGPPRCAASSPRRACTPPS